ncbi:hypothetical protein [Bosea sp. PAMC 26642]|uniref:hypothetical protein n=1 Tax=Bosea sp. (strain PAMC 26642) TaxID=1792307 RepID=UPI00076FF588|nr:hypothetical protein [Bosea sp. PAMC 26642]AMJ60957.1 hypothetical protein AXW83_12205 [Bosea sp. PAMC 26642]
MDLTHAIAAAAQALALVKGLREIDAGLSHGELKAKMADLYATMADVKMTLADAKEAMRQKDAEIAELTKRLSGRQELVEHGGYFYAKNSTGQPSGVPFCSNCLEKSGTQLRPAHQLMNVYKCPRCSAHFSDLVKLP